jgi:hypothetical protein
LADPATAQRPVPQGRSALITQRQDEPPNFQRLLAYSYLYRQGQWWRRSRALGTLVLAAAAPVIAIVIPATGDVIAAISAGWLVAGRTVLTWLEERCTSQAARIQEYYDSELFYLPWNAALAGHQPGPDDIAAAAQHIKNDAKYRNWYSIDLGDTPWPGDVLLCQRQSMVWSRQDHRAYGTAIMAAGLVWLIAGIGLAIGRDLTLADYLIKIFLPSSPAFLDTLELSRAHWQHAQAREEVEQNINDVWAAYASDPASISPEKCREIQDAAYLLRRDSPRVSELFYRLHKATSQTSTVMGTSLLRSQGEHPSQQSGSQP